MNLVGGLEHLNIFFGLHNCYYSIGWTDNLEYYKNWFLKSQTAGSEQKYPPFKEDKKGLKLKVKLETNDKIVSFLRKGSGESDWFKFYDEFDRQLKENPDKEIWCE